MKSKNLSQKSQDLAKKEQNLTQTKCKKAHKKERLVLKVGTSIISNGDILVMERLEKLCELIATLREKFHIILVSSGSVASGYTKLRLDKSLIANKQALSSIGQPLLMDTYRKILEPKGIIPAQLLPTRSTFDSRQRTAYAREVIDILLSNEILPIINENDAIAQGELISGLTLGDNDQLAAYVAHYFNAKMLVILSDVYGFFDCDPLQNKDAKLIKYVSSISQKTLQGEQKGGSKFATGGIVTKLLAADFLLAQNRSMFLCSGFDLEPTRGFLMESKHKQGTLFSKDKGIEI
ncbi:glutamate 5-kinase [Helicobacter sp. 16-1353]|uniref:glutamate 5-kinase n=1 Tax=Helicobacter sp. 16-1353 TaxID=2004996 RepID=UPI00215BD552|nr:glutamate 5-kinase [Helicobacter sp. 16-1353]